MMKEKLLQIESGFAKEIENVETLVHLEKLNAEVFGKQGSLSEVMKGMREVPKEERPVVGLVLNEVRLQIEKMIASKKEELEKIELERVLKSEVVDVSKTSQVHKKGALHPITQTFEKLIDACVEMGFTVATGPEIELDRYNFEMLNMPKDHPARDMQDSFFISPETLLRTQTSSMQIRCMEKNGPPLKIVAPGKTYRVDNDPTHTPMFHQIEGLVVDENVSMIDLKNTITKLLGVLFGSKTKIRFRPSFFPFTEPSVEVDATCPMCGGKGCARCKGTGWLELLGAGMVNPKVLENCGINSEKYCGFAFGFGVDRLAMVATKAPDLRMLFENDQRFLDQLK